MINRPVFRFDGGVRKKKKNIEGLTLFHIYLVFATYLID